MTWKKSNIHFGKRQKYRYFIIFLINEMSVLPSRATKETAAEPVSMPIIKCMTITLEKWFYKACRFSFFQKLKLIGKKLFYKKKIMCKVRIE